MWLIPWLDLDLQRKLVTRIIKRDGYIGWQTADGMENESECSAEKPNAEMQEEIPLCLASAAD
jgi:hypothetical protein